MATTANTKQKNREASQPDARVQRSKKAVLAAAHELLSQAGLGGVSVDAVSERSGVAKTTIYRHWRSRTALLLDACSNLSARPQPPDTGTLRGDLETMALYLAGRLQTAGWANVLPSIVDAAERDPKLARLQASLHGEMRGAFKVIIERGQERGEVDAAADPTEVIAAVMGPLYYRRWFSREPLDEGFVRGVVERAVRTTSPAR